MAVVEPVEINGPVTFRRVCRDSLADRLDAVRERRDVAIHLSFRLGHGRDYAVGEIVHQIDQEVAGAHGGVADLQLKQPLRRVVFFQTSNRPLARGTCLRHAPSLGQEPVQARLHQRPDRLLHDQADQIVRRVVAAGALAGEDVRADGQLKQPLRRVVFFQTSNRPLARGTCLRHAPIAAHPITERVVVVAFIADRQQVAILRIEDEQQPVEEDQSSIAHLRQPVAAPSDPTVPPLEQFLAGLRVAWREGEARPTAIPVAKPKRGRRRPDPLVKVTEQLHAWFEAEPWYTSRQLFERLQAAHPGEYPDGLLRTVQRRVKVWRKEKATAMVFGEQGEMSTEESIPASREMI